MAPVNKLPILFPTAELKMRGESVWNVSLNTSDQLIRRPAWWNQTFKIVGLINGFLVRAAPLATSTMTITTLTFFLILTDKKTLKLFTSRGKTLPLEQLKDLSSQFAKKSELKIVKFMTPSIGAKNVSLDIL